MQKSTQAHCSVPLSVHIKSNQTALKQGFFFFFGSEHSCDQKYPLPLLFSPFPGFSQPSFSGPCASCCLLELFFSHFTHPLTPTHHHSLSHSHPEAKPRKCNSSQQRDSLSCQFGDINVQMNTDRLIKCHL